MKLTIRKNPKILKYLNYSFGFFTFAWLIIGSVHLYDMYQDQRLVFLTKNSVELFLDSDPLKRLKIGLVSPNDHVKVLRVLVNDDQMLIQVYVNNHQKGWIVKNSDVDLK